MALYSSKRPDPVGSSFLLSSISSAGRPQLLLADHRPEVAQSCIDDIIARIPYEKFQQQHVSLLYSQSQIDLYRGEGSSAWKRLTSNWQRFRSSMQHRNQFARVTLLDLRARSAISAFRQSGDQDMLKHAIRDMKKLKGEYGNWVQPFVDRLAACICEVQGKSAVAQLASASDGFDRIGFRVCAAVLNLRRGQLISNSDGDELIRSATQFLHSQDVRNVQDFQRVFY